MSIQHITSRLKPNLQALYQRYQQSFDTRIIIMVLLFLILAGLWLWSRNGAEPLIRVTKIDGTVRVHFDGHMAGQADDTYQEGKNLRVELTYQDLDSPYFEGTSHSQTNNISLPPSDYDISFRVQNPYNITLHFEGSRSYSFNMAPYRHLSTLWTDPQNILINERGDRLQISVVQGLRWIAWLIMQPILFLTGLGILLIVFKPWQHNYQTTHQNSPQQNKIYHALLFGIPTLIALISIIWSRYLMITFTENIPHVPDAVSYVLLGKLIANGQLVMPFSDIPSFIPQEMYNQYLYHWYHARENFLLVPYHLGHPLVLAIGETLNIIEYIPPLVGAGVLICIYVLTYRTTHSIVFATLAMLLCFASPFFQTQTIDYMSHNTAALYLLLAIMPFVFSSNRLYFLTGLFLGLVLNTRQLTFLAVLIPYGLFILFSFIAGKSWKQALWKTLYIIAGGLGPVILFLYYNHLTTGDMFTSPYSYHGILDKIGFGENFKIGYGLLHGISNLAAFSLFFLKNYHISFLPFLLSLILVPFFPRKMLGKVLFIQLSIIVIIGVWMFYDGNFFMYGPRFIYEAVPFFAILYGITFAMLFKYAENKVWKGAIIGILAIYFIHIALFQLQWMGLRQPEYNRILYVPGQIQELKGFNASDGRFYDIWKQHRGENHTFLMKQCVHWWCHGQGVWLNSFPLKDSQPLFLTLPNEYRGEIPNAEIIDWNTMK